MNPENLFLIFKRFDVNLIFFFCLLYIFSWIFIVAECLSADPDERENERKR